jgi:hypothetical protein
LVHRQVDALTTPQALSFAADKTIKSLEIALAIADNYLFSWAARFRDPHIAFVNPHPCRRSRRGSSNGIGDARDSRQNWMVVTGAR